MCLCDMGTVGVIMSVYMKSTEWCLLKHNVQYLISKLCVHTVDGN